MFRVMDSTNAYSLTEVSKSIVLDIIRAAHYSVPANQLQSLSEDPDVTFIAPDRAVKAYGECGLHRQSRLRLETAGADLATSVFGLNGSGVGIALIDSGTNNSNDLKKCSKSEPGRVSDQPGF